MSKNINHKTAHEDKKIVDDLSSFEPEEILILKNKIENLEKEKEDYLNKLAKSKAELINYRKRKDEEVAGMLKYASKDLLLEILTPIDNLKRAIDSAPKEEAYQKFIKGFELIYNSFLDVLTKEGVTKIDVLNKTYDENVAEAIALDHNENLEDHMVTNVFADGYMYKDRLLRAAKVQVNNKGEN